MPIIAESEPIPITISSTPTHTPTPPVPSIGPSAPLPIDTPSVVTPTSITERHKQFIDIVNTLPSCFDETAIVGFTGPEFDLHLELASIDKYLIDAGNRTFCSKTAVENLSNALSRLKT